MSINRNSTNYEVDEVLCDGEKIASMALLLDRIRGGHSEVARMELEGRLMLQEICFLLSEMNQPEYCI